MVVVVAVVVTTETSNPSDGLCGLSAGNQVMGIREGGGVHALGRCMLMRSDSERERADCGHVRLSTVDESVWC